MPEDNTVLTSDLFHMRLFKTWDFLAKKINGSDIASPLTFGANDTSMPACDGYRPQPITSAGMNGWYMGIGNIELNDKKGLYNNKNGIRYVVLNGIKAGQIIVIEHSAASEKLSERVYAEDGTYTDIKENDYAINACRIQKASPDGKYPAWTVSYLENQNTEDKNVVYEITDSIHAEQAKNPIITPREDGEGNDTTYNDKFRYFRAKIDGPLYIGMGKTAAFQGVQIWIDANAKESISLPTYKLSSVSNENRYISFTSGESTFGADCSVMFGYAEEEGYTEPDCEDDGQPFAVGPDQDFNGDGKVTIEAVTVSSTGEKSDVLSFEVEIGEITLNAPTLTLVGFNDLYRSYQIEWTSNVLCNEKVTFKASGDDGDVYLDEPAVGTIITVKKNAEIEVECEGYISNKLNMDVDYPEVTITRKNQVEEDGHDVDFRKPTQDQIDIIQGKYIESVYIEDAEGKKTYYTADEYKVGEAQDGTNLDIATVVYKKSGWYAWDGSRKRASLYVDTLYVVNEEANDTTVQYRYAEDQAHLLPEGVTLECGPSTAGVSQVMTYLGNNDLGITCMSVPTLTFDRSILRAGEIVSITIGAGGGSNYLAADANGQMTKTLVYIAPTTEPLKVSLPRPASNFCHILAFDFYTLENLPEDTYDPVAIECISNPTSAVAAEIYSVSGTKVNSLQKGINLIKMTDGSVRKIMVK